MRPTSMGVAPTTSGTAVEVLVSYSHRDEKLRQALETHLSLLQRQGFISIWHDRRISPGAEWKEQINLHLDSAQVILLLVSSDFLDSDYCYDIELQHAMDRHDAGTARVIPIILRPVDWHDAPFGKLQALPKDGKPISRWSNRDEAFQNVVEGIRRAIRELRAIPPPSIPPIPSTETRLLTEQMDVLAKNLELQVVQRPTGRVYLPRTLETAKYPTSGVGVYNSSRGMEVNLSVFRDYAEDATAERLLGALRSATGSSIRGASDWPAVPCAAVINNWDRVCSEVLVPYFEARRAHLTLSPSGGGEPPPPGVVQSERGASVKGEWWLESHIHRLRDQLPYAAVRGLLDLCASRPGDWIAKAEAESATGVTAGQLNGELSALSKFTLREFGPDGEGKAKWPIEYRKVANKYAYRMSAEFAALWRS